MNTSDRTELGSTTIDANQNGGNTAATQIQTEPEYVIDRRDIILENDINSQKYCMPSIEVRFKPGPEPCLFFSDLIEKLKQMNFPLNNCMLFCWDQKREMHVFVANDPMVHPYFLPSHLCGLQERIYIKFRSFLPISQLQVQSAQQQQQQQQLEQFEQYSTRKKNGQQSKSSSDQNQRGGLGLSNNNIKEEDPSMVSDENTIFSQQQGNNNDDGDGNASQMEDGSKVGKRKKKLNAMSNQKYLNNNNNNNNTSNNKPSAIDKRVKERYIEQVRERVNQWRNMHEIGQRDKDGNLQKLNLDHAANTIGISRKTLDDYYLQLRRAEQLGFDFEKNKSEKMGTLRKFVKDESKKQSKRQGGGNTNQMNTHSPINDESEEAGENSSQEQCAVNSGSSQNLNINAFGLISSSGRGSSNNLTAPTKSQIPSLSTTPFNLVNGQQSQQQQQRISGNSQTSTNIFGGSPNQNNQLKGIGAAAAAASSLGMNGSVKQQQQNPMMTPYNFNGSTTLGYNSGGFNHPQSQFRQSPNQQPVFLQPSMGQYFQQNGRGSYMAQEPLLETLQRSSNNLGLNSQLGSQIFNPGSQFLTGQQNNNHFSNASLLNANDLNFGSFLYNDNLNGGGSLNQQDASRFSNHFSLLQFGNNSNIIEERGSINLLTQNQTGLANQSMNQGGIDGRQSNGSIYQMAEENFITSQVYPNPSSNNNSTILNH